MPMPDSMTETRAQWLLPEGMDELLPPQALRLEWFCRRLLDLYFSWGYQLVMPPLIEYLDSLLTGVGSDLELQTFKLTDQLSGHLLGVRADITPQAARIDAHKLQIQAPNRLCYLGTVLHARHAHAGESRSVLQAGAELFGHSGIESDAEVLSLMLEMLKLAGVGEVHLDLGHVGIFQALTRMAGLDHERELRLFRVLQRKAGDELRGLIASWSLPAAPAAMLTALVELHGDAEVLDEAERCFRGNDELLAYLGALRRLAELARPHLPPGCALHFDLAELRGYRYHTGLVFAAYRQGLGHALVSGGRYDHIGRAFGRSRPATGLSADMNTLARFAALPEMRRDAILAPAEDDAALQQAIRRLRAAGEIVIVALPGTPHPHHNRVLRRDHGTWKVTPAE